MKHTKISNKKYKYKSNKQISYRKRNTKTKGIRKSTRKYGRKSTRKIKKGGVPPKPINLNEPWFKDINKLLKEAYANPNKIDSVDDTTNLLLSDDGKELIKQHRTFRNAIINKMNEFLDTLEEYKEGRNIKEGEGRIRIDINLERLKNNQDLIHRIKQVLELAESYNQQ